ncbi:hypothetical protein TTHERM_000723589 (macronuclear) [Tetrahymena thermophila SB210]|uniref:Uncharacterized protein n=1 Tax=Tetrahymena thermophila (strain SB210) TaxID=312017 RepID=W7X220_TETTS|nr:hypothetical protein TTHERM_000723589 [Tetrahymena thermophila SB210]EWS71682.1 hypothetical protein TTHERM_000723589 [Tetrahymena thermophila SB210]|eukprot:XP_012655793.1 hypothetical protein TTHERM_000723589 [Tetrahymena thermophila SB210]
MKQKYGFKQQISKNKFLIQDFKSQRLFEKRRGEDKLFDYLWLPVISMKFSTSVLMYYN